MARNQSPSPGPVVRLEVRLGSAPPAVYEVGDGGFLIGGVPGCDLRLPGPSLPPVLCLIARNAAGASLRKLAPVLPISVNGKSVSSTYLDDGDRLGVGPVELLVRIQHTTAQTPVAAALPELDDRLHQLAEREQQLEAEKQELEAARDAWERRQGEIEAALRQRVQQLEKRAAEARERAPRAVEEELERRRVELDARQEELTRQEAAVEALRQEIDGIRKELAGRYHERRERLLTQQQAVHRVARKLRKRKVAVEEREARALEAEQQLSTRQLEIDGGREQLERERQLVEEQHRLFASRQQEVQRELHERVADLEAREEVLAQARAALEKGQKQHQSDLVRLDRIQGAIEARQKALEGRALEIDRKYEQLQRDTRDMEEQARQLDDWHTRLSSEDQQLQARKAEVDAQTAQLDQRASALESQQTMLATLRTRLERLREEVRNQEQALSDQRALQEAAEADLADRLQVAERQRQELDAERQLFDEERRRYEERRAVLDQAVATLRQTQEALEREQAEVESRQKDLDAVAEAQAQQAEQLLARGEQLEQVGARLQADRQVMRDREANLTKAEATLAGLQEQVRKRVEELNDRQRGLEQGVEALAKQRLEFEAQRKQGEEAHRQAAGELEQLRQQMEERAAELLRGEEELKQARERLDEAEQSQTSQRQALAAERVSWEVERQVAQEQDRQAREELQRGREEAQALLQQLPELELRAAAALERLARSREQLREHLGEIHTYARQSREDLDAARKLVQGDVERVRQQELDLEVARDEHRLAVAAFRQQLIDWQGRVGELRQNLQLGSTRLELRQAAVEEQARQLAEEAEQLERDRQVVSERRGVMDRHLSDMQEWYRKKLRDLAGVDAPPGSEPGEGDVVPMPVPSASPPRAEGDDRNPARAVLTLNDEVEPADRQLGELLASQGLVDEDTLQALWADARRQRRSLRQLLLAGGYLTLYQMALIEAGNLDGLVLGPVRIIDKVTSNPREAVYRVFDPSRKAEALLRHLAEGELLDAVHPDEFRQRFSAAAAVTHGNVQAVLEVLDISGRPAALVEWVDGLPSSDWPGLVSAPGVWYRLVCQAALALQAAHEAGLAHGHLDGGSFVLTGEGTLKLVGLGEPAWLAAPGAEEGDGPAADLLALGRLAADWAARAPTGKGAKAKPLPEGLQAVLARLMSEEEDRQYPSTQALVEDLERAGAKVSASTPAWERLVKQAREQKPAGMRESA